MASALYAINRLDETINSFKSRVDVKVTDVDNSTASIRSTADRIYENIERFKVDMLHGEETQIAHENILRIDQIIKEQFGNHEAIRRTVLGIVKDFDINLVRNSTIQELSEELWITSSRYWLSYALLAITAWVNNYPDVAKNALSECGRKDAIKTTLFFCLTNLRFGRMEAAKKWFYEYFNTLDPTMLQQETAILLQSFLNGIFGKDKELEGEITKLIDNWITIIEEQDEISAQLVESYYTYIQNLHPECEFNYPKLLKHCAGTGILKQTITDASKYELLVDFVKELDVCAVEQTDENYKNRVNAILAKLITNYDADELELRRQQAYYRCIADNKGDVEAAEAQFTAMMELENEHFNVGKQMVRWAIYDDSEKTDVQVRKFGFQKTKGWFTKAVESFDSELSASVPTHFDLSIDTWKGTTDGNDEANQHDSIEAHFKNNKLQNTVVNKFNAVVLAILVISAIVGVIMIAAGAGAWALIVTGVCAIILVIRVIVAFKKYPNRINAAKKVLSECIAEIAEYRRSYEEKHAMKDELFSMVEFL